MTAQEFKSQLTEQLLQLDIVHFVDLIAHPSYVDGKVYLKWEMMLNVFYHEKSLKLNFALIQNAKRIWAIDNHKPNGWHRHPLHDVATHQPIDPIEIEAIVAELEEVIQNIQE